MNKIIDFFKNIWDKIKNSKIYIKIIGVLSLIIIIITGLFTLIIKFILRRNKKDEKTKSGLDSDVNNSGDRVGDIRGKVF